MSGALSEARGRLTPRPQLLLSCRLPKVLVDSDKRRRCACVLSPQSALATRVSRPLVAQDDEAAMRADASESAFTRPG